MAYDAPYPPNARLMGMGWTCGVADKPDAACSIRNFWGQRGGYPFSRSWFWGQPEDHGLLYAGCAIKIAGLEPVDSHLSIRALPTEATSQLRYATYRLGDQ